MRRLIAAGLFVFATATALPAQVPPPPPSGQQPQPEDTVKVPRFRVEPPVSPLGATWRSLLLPGWGQSILGRRVTGAAFIFWEGITLTMTIKSAHQLHYQESIGSDTIDDKRKELQDWAVLLAFNHLLAAAEAYVAALLWDFPAELEMRTLPTGGLAAGVKVSF